uniref:Uncharacterized protein AlNc14C199G8632 n=1 Tax=Albugo laibachii Nc14 TaxID=890382 RepID=F0WQG1_9STRA|nr:conserved hypothetical protein [Albugo laibachii Nc14]|eukprot:CCA23570.1 conserved hypothetical protein [Albugo laibachii Nc14]
MATEPAIEKYASFIQGTLKPQLQSCLQARDKFTHEIEEYEELLKLVEELQQGVGTQHNGNQASSQRNILVNLGAQFYVRAKIEHLSTILVDVGLQFHVEMTLEEAKDFVQNHLKHLQSQFQLHQQKAKTVSSHLRSAVQAIEQLMMLQQS